MLISSNYYFQTQFTSAGKYMNILIKQNTIQILFNLIVLWNFKESKHYIKTNFVTFPKRLATTDFHLQIFLFNIATILRKTFLTFVLVLCSGQTTVQQTSCAFLQIQITPWQLLQLTRALRGHLASSVFGGLPIWHLLSARL